MSEIVLYKLYRAHIEDDTKDAYTFEDIQQMLAHQVSRKMVLTALKLLNTQDRGKSSINRSRKAGEYQYAISTEGIFQIERALNRGNSVATYLNRHPDATLDEVAGFDGLFFTQDERFEADVWKPLPIDRNRDAFKKALRDVEDAYDAIRSDNGFASEFPEIRNGIVDDLNTGIEKLKKEKTTINQLVGYVFSPLKWVAANFSNSVIGVAAKNAADSLWKYIYSLFGSI